MRYASAAAFRQALEARLAALSRDGGVSLMRLRKAVAFDRLLARLLPWRRTDGSSRVASPSTTGWGAGPG